MGMEAPGGVRGEGVRVEGKEGRKEGRKEGGERREGG